jgi:hypothetical protein
MCHDKHSGPPYQHSLEIFGWYWIVWQQQIAITPQNSLHFGSDLMTTRCQFLTQPSSKYAMAWHQWAMTNIWGHPINIHYSLEIFVWYWIVWQQQICYDTSKYCAFWFWFDDNKVPISDTAKLKICHGVTPMTHEKHLWGHPINIHWGYMDDME